MKTYEKPVVMVNEEVAEGVYASSGCLVATFEGDNPTVYIASRPQPDDLEQVYTIEVGGTHIMPEGAAFHKSGTQTVYITFNQAVTHDGVTSTTITSSCTNTLNNDNENFGWGITKVYYDGDEELEIIGVTTSCTPTN